MAQRQPAPDTTVFATGNYDPVGDLPRLSTETVICPPCGGSRVVSQPAHDLQPGREAKCLDCGHTGRVKTNEYGRVEWIQGFRFAGGRGE